MPTPEGARAAVVFFFLRLVFLISSIPYSLALHNPYSWGDSDPREEQSKELLLFF